MSLATSGASHISGGGSAVDTDDAPLAPRAVAEFHEQGFLVVRQLLPAADVALIRHTLSVLFAGYPTLSRRIARDLGDVARHAGPPQIPEISRIAALAPALASSRAFRRCRGAARQLLGAPAHYRSDHAIYKPPHNGSETPWHQDEAYVVGGQPETVHFWLALQDVSMDMGCMQFLPGSHRTGTRPHRPRTAAAAMLATDVGAVDPVVVPLSSGDVTVHHPRTLHYTGPNCTDRPRFAWILHFSARPSRLRLLVDPPPRLGWMRPVTALAVRGLARTLP